MVIIVDGIYYYVCVLLWCYNLINKVLKWVGFLVNIVCIGMGIILLE